ncbi:MAG: hypothetical protein MUC92_06490 [Fimbriimonadaceae bacterium]|jgi:hypothetical protein|nr:hypothetical protein [Fimbriimonadaceae bacterium]
MFTATLAALTLTPFAYGFSPDAKHEYQMTVKMEGFLPLLGGNEGTAEVAMGVLVLGLAGENGNRKATNEITSSELKFNGAKLPLTVRNVQDFFPKTTVVFSPQGRIISNSAPDRALPVQLPGLHIRRFPDITYLPLEIPEAGVQVGESFQFVKNFGDAPLNYTVTPKTITDKDIEFDVRVSQNYTVLENDALEVVKDRADAVSEVTTRMTGNGTVVLNREAGVPIRVKMVNTAVSEVRELAGTGSKITERKLVSTLEVVRVGPGSLRASEKKAPSPPARASNQSARQWTLDPRAWWSTTTRWVGDRMQDLQSYLTMGRMALALAASQIPGGTALMRFILGG